MEFVVNNIYRRNGNNSKVTSNTKDVVSLVIDGSMYNDNYMDIDNTAKTVLDGILKYMTSGTNLIHIGGEQLQSIISFTGYTEGTVRKAVVRLNASNIVEKTTIRGEYIVNPLFAYKGDNDRVWLSYKSIEEELKERNKKQSSRKR